MPNRKYLKGRRKEYKVCDEYKALNYTVVQRTAGSHSPIDVIAIDQDLKVIKLIQAKSDNMTDAAKLKLMDKHNRLNGIYHVEFIVV